MASFAKNIRSNSDYKAAAGALNMRPSEVKTREAFQRVKAYAKKQPTPATTPATPAAPASPVVSGNNYTPATASGNLVNSGIQTITDLLGKYPGNETLAGLGTGAIFDIGKTQANTGLALQYNDAFLASLGGFQRGLENLKTANTSRLMAEEGAIARDLTDLTTRRALQGIEYGADKGLEGSKYSADRGLEGSKYSADKSLDATRYSADKGYEGIKYGYDSQERQIGLRGEQDRLNMAEEGNQQLRLRADARGAIRSQGARFYG